MVELTIDGRDITVPDDATILDAARQEGIWIPTLCHNEALSPYGGCRLCIVEVTRSGSTSVVASCAYRVEDGLIVETATDTICALRRGILELLLAEAPQAQVLQDLARSMGVVQPARYIARNELCIACGQCVRACREIVGVSAIDFVGRGYDRIAATPFLKRSDDCIGCGTCVEVCPTGAVTVQDIPEGADGSVPTGEAIAGPARIMTTWKTALGMKRCTKCGEPFAPVVQLDHIRKKASLADDCFEVCINCRS